MWNKNNNNQFKSAEQNLDSRNKDSRNKKRNERGSNNARGPRSNNGGRYWIFGKHAVSLALENKKRKIYKLMVSEKMREEISDNPQKFFLVRDLLEVVPGRDLAKLARLPEDAAHQGIAALVAPLEQPDLEELIAGLDASQPGAIVILDKVSDPHNIGAILRSCAAFGVHAVVTTQDGSPEENGVIAKSASGALELVPYIRVVNLARALRFLQDNYFFVIGFALNTEKIMKKSYFEAHSKQKIALVFGSEESGLRRLTQESCDELVKIALEESSIDSLNVSNAVAVALYQQLLARLS